VIPQRCYAEAEDQLGTDNDPRCARIIVGSAYGYVREDDMHVIPIDALGL
jgi:hypothetical protein